MEAIKQVCPSIRGAVNKPVKRVGREPRILVIYLFRLVMYFALLALGLSNIW